jgi:uncharacterized protein
MTWTKQTSAPRIGTHGIPGVRNGRSRSGAVRRSTRVPTQTPLQPRQVRGSVLTEFGQRSDACRTAPRDTHLPSAVFFTLLAGALACVAGAVASVAGFGIGSLLTPALALVVSPKVAVAAVAIPHLAATAFRFWMLHAHVDRRVFGSFGLASAAGGLLGALAHSYASSPLLAVVFGILLVFAGGAEITGLAERMRFSRRVAWVAGVVSGVFGGMVGNQGGIRSAALLGLEVRKEELVGTATAIALLVDLVRVPIYLAGGAKDISAIWPLVAVATAGVILGTALGTGILARLPEQVFRRVLAVLLIVLGVSMLVQGVA